MTLVLGWYHTSDGSQVAIADGEGNDYETVCILSETEADGLTPGQMAFKHNVPSGQDVGHFSFTKN